MNPSEGGQEGYHRADGIPPRTPDQRASREPSTEAHAHDVECGRTHSAALEVPVPSRRLIALITTLLALSTLLPAAAVAAPSISTRTVQSGLVIPWDVAFGPDGQMFV